MLLCDIGNSFAHFYNLKDIWIESLDDFIDRYKENKVYYINVNEKIKKRLSSQKNWIDLEKYIDFKTEYKELGVDRKVACIAIEDGVVVDAGSAITVDLMENGIHLGGFIMPGIKAIDRAFKNISQKLSYEIDFDIDLSIPPLNTKDAISYGTIKPIILAIDDFAKDKKLFFTGGDGEKLSKFFKNSAFDKKLIFKGMIKIIKDIQC